MSSSDRHINEASPKQKSKRYTQQFKVEWLKDTYLKG